MLVIALCSHLIADFYFQWDSLAEAKRHNRNALFLHCGIYFIVFIAVGMWSQHVMIMMILALLHAVVDGLFYINQNNGLGYSYSSLISMRINTFMKNKFYGEENSNRSNSKAESANLFLADQLIHILMIIVFTSGLVLEGEFMIAPVVLLFLIIYKPASVLIREMTSRFQVEKDGDDVDGGGSLIGYMERTIMLVSLVSGENSLMIFGFGFVLTAKTISRYGKTREDENFAQYFVIGTMMSVLICLLSYLILNMIIYL